MKKELFEIAQCIPWVRNKLNEKSSGKGGTDCIVSCYVLSVAQRTKIWSMYKYIDTIYDYRQLYTVKEKIDLEWYAFYSV